MFNIIEYIVKFDLLEVVKAFASVAMVGIAFSALRNWQRQDKAKREAEFLDSLIEAAQTYIAELYKHVKVLEISAIGVESLNISLLGCDMTEIISKYNTYLQQCAQPEFKRLVDLIKVSQPSAIKLRSLETKGQVFKFDNYDQCRNAIAEITRHSDRFETFVIFMESSQGWRWEHPKVQEYFKEVIAINYNEIRDSIIKNNNAIVEFARDTYALIYGGGHHKIGGPNRNRKNLVTPYLFPL
ncbi:MAG: hypothetical protein HQL96_00745 [Magnetococcales bacterium]|nr:hypothetical protein [Magnetococcales bacterium]